MGAEQHEAHPVLGDTARAGPVPVLLCACRPGAGGAGPRNGRAHTDAHVHAHPDAFPYAISFSDAHADRYAYADAFPYAYAYVHADAYAYVHAHTDLYAHAPALQGDRGGVGRYLRPKWDGGRGTGDFPPQ